MDILHEGMHIYDNISLNFSYNEMLQTEVVEKIITHILCSATILWKLCC
jgi:hypothetical protein